MLDVIRNLVSSIFGKILLAIMVMSFALWGVGDILSSGNSQLAAKVGKEKITLDEFYMKFQETVENYNQNTGSKLNLKEAYEIQLHNLLLQDLVYSKMISDYAKQRGLSLSNDALKLIVIDLPQFQNNDRTFSNTRYKNFILNNFQTEEIFLQEIENTAYQGLLFENFNINNYQNRSIIDILFNYEGEKRSIEYFLFDKEEIKVEINDKLLNDYFLKNKNKYSVPEQSIIDVIEINIENFKKLEDVSIATAKQYYDSNIQLYTTDESRDVKFLRFTSEKDASNFYEINKNSNNDQLSLFMKENNLEFSILKEFTGDAFSEEITNQIFQLEINKLSKPIKYDELGFYIFNVSNVSNKEITKFDSVKDEIINYLALELAYQEFDESINLADEMLINDYSFEEIAESQLNAIITKNINLEDLKIKIGGNYASLDIDRPAGFVSEVIINENIAYIYKINKKQNSYVPELHKIKSKVESDFIDYEREIKLLNKTDNLINKLLVDNATSFENFLLENNYKLQISDKISRTSDDFSSETIEKIFNLKKMQPFKLIQSDGEIGIGVIKEIISPRNQISGDFYDSVKSNINNNFNSSLSDAIGSEIIDNSTYEIYTQNIDKLFM